jgi:hypothetical protein
MIYSELAGAASEYYLSITISMCSGYKNAAAEY